jgi:acyl dehydratase
MTALPPGGTTPPNPPETTQGVTVISSRALARHVGERFSSPFSIEVDQERVRAFADLTGGDHWMHVDVERAAASPLGRTTVQGLLTMSLGVLLQRQVLVIESADSVFYGFDRVRFPAPLFTGDELRLEVEILIAEERPGSVRAGFRQHFWSGGEKPVCVVEQSVRYFHEGPQ